MPRNVFKDFAEYPLDAIAIGCNSIAQAVHARRMSSAAACHACGRKTLRSPISPASLATWARSRSANTCRTGGFAVEFAMDRRVNATAPGRSDVGCGLTEWLRADPLFDAPLCHGIVPPQSLTLRSPSRSCERLGHLQTKNPAWAGFCVSKLAPRRSHAGTGSGSLSLTRLSGSAGLAGVAVLLCLCSSTAVSLFLRKCLAMRALRKNSSYS